MYIPLFFEYNIHLINSTTNLILGSIEEIFKYLSRLCYFPPFDFTPSITMALNAAKKLLSELPTVDSHSVA